MWSPDCWKVPMAPIPSPAPVWMLPGTAPKYWEKSLCYKRPSTCSTECKRWHCGIDLPVKAGSRARAVAAEVCTVIPAGSRIERGWTEKTTAVMVRNASTWAIYGGLEPGSATKLLSPNQKLEPGDDIGVIAAGYDMLHFELYDGTHALKGNQRWYIGESPPPALLNPINYVQVATGDTPTLETPPQRHEALRVLGFWAGPTFAPWSDASKTALKAAQASLGVGADGVWGPETETAIRRALGGRSPVPPESSYWTFGRVAGWTAAALAAGLVVGTILLGDRA